MTPLQVSSNNDIGNETKLVSLFGAPERWKSIDTKFPAHLRFLKSVRKTHPENCNCFCVRCGAKTSQSGVA